MKIKFDLEETFNSEEYLYFYSDVLSQERQQEEVDFLVKYTELDRSKEILDLACGHGRHANALAQLGHKVTGIDITEGFLKLAKKEASKFKVKVKYIQDDMRNINYNQSFDRIYVMYTAIGYFDDEDNEQVFRKIFKALKPGGIFCFDSHNRDTFLTYFQRSSVVERDGNFMLDQRSYDSLTGHCLTKRTIIYKNNKKSFHFTVRFYNPTDILKLFKEVGFSSVTFYENWAGKLLGQDSKRMIIVAKK